MSDQKENLSAFLDDDLGQDEHLQIDASGEQTLAHYSLIGDAMRGEVNAATMLDVSQQVRQAIAEEPFEAVAARPAPVKQAAGGFASWFDFSSWLQPVGGLAIAASVAMIAVVTLDQQEQAGTAVGNGQVAESQPVEPAMTASPVRAVASRAQQPVLTPVSAPGINLDQYMDEHSEFAASDTLQGRLPYVRAVGYKTRSR